MVALGLIPDRLAPEVFEDYALLEEGSAREFIGPDLLRPAAASGGWVQCSLRRGPEAKTEFRLCEEKTGRFLLSARRVGDRFLISSYDPQSSSRSSSPCKRPRRVEKTPTKRAAAAAVLEPAATRASAGGQKPNEGGIALTLTLCSSSGFDSPEALATVWPSAKWSKEHQAEFRRLRISLPSPSAEAEAHYMYDLSPRLPARSRPAGDGAGDDEHREGAENPRGRKLLLANKVPAWSPQLSSLSLKFARKRVTCSSSKNFLVYTEADLRLPKRAAAADNAVFQLGKRAPRTFALDYQHPLSAIQAFGIALAAFH